MESDEEITLSKLSSFKIEKILSKSLIPKTVQKNLEWNTTNKDLQ